jgi:hypothetical protein
MGVAVGLGVDRKREQHDHQCEQSGHLPFGNHAAPPVIRAGDYRGTQQPEMPVGELSKS